MASISFRQQLELDYEVALERNSGIDTIFWLGERIDVPDSVLDDQPGRLPVAFDTAWVFWANMGYGPDAVTPEPQPEPQPQPTDDELNLPPDNVFGPEPRTTPELIDALAGLSDSVRSVLSDLVNTQTSTHQDITQIQAQLVQVPVSVAQHVGPILAESEGRVRSLIEGLIPSDLGALLDIVPALASFLDDPLSYLFDGGLSISQEVLDSVRS